MDATELYQQILGIRSPWYVDGVNLDHQAAKVTVQLEHRAEGFVCPKCGVAVSVYDDALFAVQVQSRAAELLRLSDDQVRWLQHRAVERRLRRRDPERARPHVMMDEKSLHAGHHDVTILSDGTHGEVLDVVEHRTTEAATELLGQTLSESRKATVKAVSVDMWAPFAQAAKVHLPDAELVYDRFHLSEHLNSDSPIPAFERAA